MSGNSIIFPAQGENRGVSEWIDSSNNGVSFLNGDDTMEREELADMVGADKGFCFRFSVVPVTEDKVIVKLNLNLKLDWFLFIPFQNLTYVFPRLWCTCSFAQCHWRS